MKLKIITHMLFEDSFLGDSDIEKTLNLEISKWLKAAPRKNPRIINSTVYTTSNGDPVYQVHIAYD